MQVISLERAVQEICSAYANREPGRQPFFYLVGAGISSPVVPMAADIIRHCKARASLPSEASDQKPLDEYSHWFDRAYPQPIDRQRYLRGLIERKPITDACFRLAHLLGSGKAGNLVVTPNFDDFIGRALSIFGVSYSVSDHPDTVDRIDLGRDEINLVHVHGSYKFYDCRNLSDELEHRARPSLRSVRTMAAFLDRVLSFCSPLIVGYSGWTGDVIMSALKRRLDGSSLPYRLYWFCYKREIVDDLTSRAPWLTEHQDVRLVVPDGDTSVDASRQSVLTARVVLEELIRALKVEEPALTQSPVRFYADQLRASVEQPEDRVSSEGVYSFARVVARLERAAKLEDDERTPPASVSVVLNMETVRQLLRTGQFDQALVAAKAAYQGLSLLERRDLFSSLVAYVRENELYPKDTITAVDLIMKLGADDELIKASTEFEQQQPDWWQKKGEAFYRLGEFQPAIDAFEKVLSGRGLPKEKKHYAMSRKALALTAEGREKEATAVYEALIPELESNDWFLAQSKFNYAMGLLRADRVDEALVQLRNYVSQFERNEDVFTQVLVIGAMRRIASIHEDRGDKSTAIEMLRSVVTKYAHVSHEQVASGVVQAMLQLAELVVEGNPEESLKLTEAIASLLPEHSPRRSKLLAESLEIRDRASKIRRNDN